MSRWNTFLTRFRVCAQAARAINGVEHDLAEAARTLEGAPDDAGREAAEALRLAEQALNLARERLQRALEAKKLTPANREASYGLELAHG